MGNQEKNIVGFFGEFDSTRTMPVTHRSLDGRFETTGGGLNAQVRGSLERGNMLTDIEYLRAVMLSEEPRILSYIVVNNLDTQSSKIYLGTVENNFDHKTFAIIIKDIVQYFVPRNSGIATIEVYPTTPIQLFDNIQIPQHLSETFKELGALEVANIINNWTLNSWGLGKEKIASYKIHNYIPPMYEDQIKTFQFAHDGDTTNSSFFIYYT